MNLSYNKTAILIAETVSVKILERFKLSEMSGIFKCLLMFLFSILFTVVL